MAGSERLSTAASTLRRAGCPARRQRFPRARLRDPASCRAGSARSSAQPPRLRDRFVVSATSRSTHGGRLPPPVAAAADEKPRKGKGRRRIRVVRDRGAVCRDRLFVGAGAGLQLADPC
jgi:hypothetical protein